MMHAACVQHNPPDPAGPLHCSCGRVQAAPLGKGNLFGVRPIQQPDGYVAVMPYPACLHGMASSSLPTHLLRLGAMHCDIVAAAAAALIAAALWVFVCVLAYQMIGLMC